MGNVLGINTVTNTVFVRNSGSLLDTLYSVTIFAACNKGALLSNNSGWIVSSTVNSEDSDKLDITFTYDNNGDPLSINEISGAISIGLVEGIGAVVDPSNVLVHWTRSSSGNINVASGVETTVSIIYKFANYIFNNNIKFTSNDYIVNNEKFCAQEYSPVKSIISSSVIEDGHNVVVVGSVTVGPGLWYIVCSGGFNLTNKKYFFLADKIVSDFSSTSDYYNDIKGDDEIMSSFGTHQIASGSDGFLGYDNAAILRITFTVGTTQYSENMVSDNYTDADDLFNAVVSAMNNAYPAGSFGFDALSTNITSSVEYTFNFSTMNIHLSNAIVGGTSDITAHVSTNSYFVLSVMNGYDNFEGYNGTPTIKFTVGTTQYSEDIVSDNYTDVDVFLGAVVSAMNTAYPAGNFAFDIITKIISSEGDYTFNFSTMNIDLSNAIVSCINNIYPVNTSIVYTGAGSSNVVRWCFTCEDNSASSIIFNKTVTSTNTYVNGRPNNLVMCAIKISS